MEESNALLDAIWQETCAAVDAVKQEADAYVEARHEEASETARHYRAEQTKVTDAMCEEVLAKKRVQADMDSRNRLLAEKRALLDGVYRTLQEKLSALSKKDYAILVQRLLENYAEEGDVVRLAATAPVYAAEAGQWDVVKAKRLCVVTDDGIDSGLLIEGKAFDKDLRWPALCAMLKESGEMALSQRLFDNE